MWETGTILRTDPFSYTFPEGRWVRFEWLAEWVGWWLNLQGGLALFTACAMFAFALLPVLFWRFLMHRGITTPVALVYSLSTVVILHAHLLARPFLFTYIFTLIVMHLWYVHLEGPRRALGFALPALFLLWANLHAGFVGGLLFLGLAWTGRGLDRWKERLPIFDTVSRNWLGLIGLCVLATLVNPYGIELHHRILQTIFSIKSVGLLEESGPLDFGSSLPMAIGFFVVIFTLILARDTKVKLSWMELLPVLVFLYFGFKTRRHVFVLLMFSALPVTRIWQAWLESWWTEKTRLKWREFTATQQQLCSELWLIPVTMLVTWFLFKGSVMAEKLELGSETLRSEARAFISQHLDRFQKPINHTGNAGPLMYYFHPKIHVILDDRIDFYGDELTQKYLDLVNLRSGWREKLNQGGYDSAILSPNDLFVRELEMLPEWKRVYLDPGTKPQTVIFWKEPVKASQGK